jgi:hypothetical protein
MKTHVKRVGIIGLTITMLMGVICLMPAFAAEPERHGDEANATSRSDSMCVQPFEIAIHQGPSAGLVLQGMLALQVKKDGRIDNGVFVLPDGSRLTVVGQTHGRAVHLLVDRGDGQFIFGVGTGQQAIRECTGPVGGPAVGPLPGDSGAWDVLSAGPTCARAVDEALWACPSLSAWLSERCSRAIDRAIAICSLK